MSITLQQIFEEHFDSFLSRQRISPDMYRAGWYVRYCRTAMLGGHVNSCPDGHYHEIAYNSCRHRCCPQCQWLPRERWLDGWRERLLPCPHHHVVFTLPKACLLPRKVLMIKFRGKFKAMLRAKVKSGKIRLPKEMTPEALDRLLSRLTGKPWNVKIHEAYEHGQGVATYLARYLKGGPINDSRLIDVRDGDVIFRYRLGTDAGGDGKRQGVKTLPVDTFMRRWLEHVPPKGFQAVRGYGLYCGNQYSQLDEAREAWGLAPVVVDEAKPQSWQEWCESAGMVQACRCPICGKRLVADHEFNSERGPPSWALEFEQSRQPA